MDGMTLTQYLEQRFRQFVAAAHPHDRTGNPRTPYRWQLRLMSKVASDGRWPERIVAPTASGKTCVIDIHVFLNAMAGLQEVAELPEGLQDVRSLHGLPRRLALTVNRRSLVDDQYDEARELQRRILSGEQSDGDDGDILRECRRGLAYRSGGRAEDRAPAMPRDDDGPLTTLIVTELRGGMGGSPEQREWRYYPQTCAVICTTPDMFGSRLLFRGYGTSAAMRPMEAGELAYDTVLVADEAHLSRQLLETARQIPRIEAFSKDSIVRDSITPLQVVETTATPTGNEGRRDHSGTSVSVEENDFAIDTDLARRLSTPKTVTVDLRATKKTELIGRLVDSCGQMILDRQSSDEPDGIVGCVVNTVDTARQVFKKLEAWRKKQQIARPIVSYVGPMRPHDKDRAAAFLSSAFSGENGKETPCCIIGTQTLEVGVDADFTDLVTELAPAGALVQRAGRVNRRGLRASARIVVIGVSEEAAERERIKEAIPYRLDDLEESLRWIRTLPSREEGHDLSAWAVQRTVRDGHPLPMEHPRRLLYQRLEPWDVENLSHTDERLFADCAMPELQQTPSDVNLWLRDDLSADDGPSVGVVVRTLPWDDAVASKVLESAPPTDDELFPIRTREQITGSRSYSLLSYLPENNDDDSIKGKADSSGRCVLHPRRLFLYRPSDPVGQRVHVFRRREDFHKFSSGIKAGDIIVVDAYAPLFDSQQVFAPELDLGSREIAHDVFTMIPGERTGEEADGRPGRELGDIAVIPVDRTKPGALRDAVERLLGQDESIRRLVEDGSSSWNDDDLERLRENLPGLIDDVLAAMGYRDATKAGYDTVDWYEDRDEHVIIQSKDGIVTEQVVEHDDWWLVLRNGSSLVGSEESQEATPRHRVFLNAESGHQRHVADRAQSLGRQIGLPEALCQALQMAGLYHDEGKKDERFQRMLRHDRPRGDAPYLAKSGFSSWSFERRFRDAHQLSGWRHEQRSVAEFMVARDRKDDGAIQTADCDIALVERLIGTSHGHGRSAFRHATSFLLPEGEEQYDPQLVEWSRRLFDRGEWEYLIDRTNQRYGFWGVAYLESLLRAADITESKEGR